MHLLSKWVRTSWNCYTLLSFFPSSSSSSSSSSTNPSFLLSPSIHFATLTSELDPRLVPAIEQSGPDTHINSWQCRVASKSSSFISENEYSHIKHIFLLRDPENNGRKDLFSFPAFFCPCDVQFSGEEKAVQRSLQRSPSSTTSCVARRRRRSSFSRIRERRSRSPLCLHLSSFSFLLSPPCLA